MDPEREFQLWLVIVGALAGLAPVLLVWLSSRIYNWLCQTPKLVLKADRDPPPDITIADWYYARVSVQNTERFLGYRVLKRQTAANCRCFLVQVERWNDTKHEFELTPFRDAIQLVWSYVPAIDAFSIPGDLRKHADIVRCIRNQDLIELQLRGGKGEWLSAPAFDAIFAKPGRFCVEVLVTADNVGSVRKPITIVWDGRELTVRDGRVRPDATRKAM